MMPLELPDMLLKAQIAHQSLMPDMQDEAWTTQAWHDASLRTRQAASALQQTLQTHQHDRHAREGSHHPGRAGQPPRHR